MAEKIKKPCGCGGKGNKAASKGATATVRLAGGTQVKVRASEAAAYASRHPGSKVL